MRVLTFQSEDVIHTIIKEGVYRADLQFRRERRDYTKDIEQLDGAIPIWCFTPVTTKPFEAEDFRDGSLFSLYKCEMSLNTYLSVFPMIELEVPDNMLKQGLTHNGYSGAKVFSHISKDMLKAVYRLSYDEHYFYPKILLAKAYSDDVLFTHMFQCRK
ncbi:hypothetical protein D3C71_1402150 [compost metagenome]